MSIAMSTNVHGPRFAPPALDQRIARLGSASVQVNGITIGSKTVDFSQMLNLEDVHLGVIALKELNYDFVLPTVVTTKPQVYQNNLPVFAQAMQTDWGRGFIVGVHCEGPLIHPEQKGAHPLDCILDPRNATGNMKFFRDLLKWSRIVPGRKDSHCVAMVTLDPSRDPGLEISRFLSANGVVVCMAHHQAKLRDFQNLVRVAGSTGVGAIHVPNTWNFGPNGRDTGFLMHYVLSEPQVTVHVVVDGRHVPDDQVKYMYDAVGPDRFSNTDDVSPLLTAMPRAEPYQAFGRDFRIHAPEDVPAGKPWPNNDGWTHSLDLSGSTVPGLWQAERLAKITAADDLALEKTSFGTAARAIAVPLNRLGLTVRSKNSQGPE